MTRTRLADRYLARAVGVGVLGAWAVLGALMVLFALLGELGDVGRRGYGLGDALAFVALSAPRRVYEVLPAAALIGSALGLGALARAGEITALRAAGVSLAHMAGVVAAAALPVLTVGALLGEGLATRLETRAQASRAVAQGRPALAGTRGGVWHRHGAVVLHVAQVRGADAVAGIEAWQFDAQRRVLRTVRAPTAQYAGARWAVQDAVVTEVKPDALRSATVASLPAPFIPPPTALAFSRADPQHLPAGELMRQARVLEHNGRSAAAYRLALWKKVSAPLTVLVLALLGLALVLTSGRALGLGQRLFVAVSVGLVFYLFDQTFGNAALAFGLPLWAAALAPTALAAGVFVAGMRRGGRV